MRVLITGGFGFVGGRLGQKLIECGYEVLLGSRKFQEVPNWIPKAEVVQTDWNNKTALIDLCANVDVVIHTAGMNAQACASDPEQALAFNGTVTADLVSSAVKQGVQKFIYLSTAHVYKVPLVGTISEFSQTTNTHPYATSHLAGEIPVLEASKNSKIDGIVIRLSNSFGAPTHSQVDCWMLLVNDLCRQAIITGKLVLQTSGNQVRDFVPLTDVCRAIEYLIQTDTDQLNLSVLNIGSGKPCTVLEITHLVQECCMDSLNFKPVIYRSESSELEKNEILNFQMTWLKSSNFIFAGEPRLEIEQLLNFCQLHFSKKDFIQ
jgi:UDP-glucose 4-epimerase